MTQGTAQGDQDGNMIEDGIAIEQAPVNPQYLQYQNEILYSSGMSQADNGWSMGVIPAPVDLSHLQGGDIAIASVPLAGYPATYDLRSVNKVTAIRNQGASGSCWAHATLASLESFLLANESHDLSENNMKNRHGFDIGPNDGGNFFMSTAYLTRWEGPVSESDDPYDDYSTTSPAGLPAQKHVQDVLYLPQRSGYLNNDDIKSALMTYGAVYTTFHINWNGFSSSGHNMSYYSNNVFNDGWHAVTIVGWDDNFNRNNFSYTAPGNGAFIIKNSWGESWGDDGYFYMSYYEPSFGASEGGYAVFTGEPTYNYTKVYQYDPLGWISNIGYTGYDSAWMRNDFTITSSNEYLSAVGFYTGQINSTYEIHVFQNGVELKTKSGTVHYPGYHTINLDSYTALSQAYKLRIEVKIRTPGYYYPICVENPSLGYSMDAIANGSESFISRDRTTWTDLTTVFTDSNVCLKAYTTDLSGAVAGRVSFGEGMWLPGASVNIVDANNINNVLYMTTTDINGFYQIVNVMSTNGQLSYREHVSKIGYGEGLSEAFGVNRNATTGVNVVVIPEPSLITLSMNNNTVLTNGTDAKLLSANVKDIVGRPVPDGYVVNFSLSDTAAGRGQFAPEGAGSPTGNTISVATVDGFANVSFGWALVSGTNTIRTVMEDFPGVNKSQSVNIVDEMKPFVQFSSPSYATLENLTTITLNVALSEGLDSVARINFTTKNGTALSGADYIPLNGTMTFNPYEVSNQIVITLVNDAVFELNESFYVELSGPTSNIRLGSPVNVTVTIQNDDAKPVILLAPDSYTPAEGISPVINVIVTGSAYIPVYVNYTTVNGTALAGTDYVRTYGTLTINPGEILKTIPVSTVNDAIYENIEVFNFTLVNTSNEATLGATRNATISIIDDDVKPTVQFASASYSASENNATVRVNVTLTGTLGVPANINYTTVNGTGLAGVDYVRTNGMLTFNVSESLKTITISLLNDVYYETGETFFVELSDPAWNIQTGSPYNTTVTIVDNDAQPTVRFSSSTYNVNENAGQAVISLLVTGITESNITVNYATSDNTAIADTDYLTTQGTLNITKGMTSISFYVPIINDTENDGNKALNLTLSGISSNAILVAPSQATLNILDDEGISLYELQLKRGWNMVSLPVINDTIRASDFNGTEVIIVAVFNRTTLGFNSYLIGISEAYEDLLIQPDYGYLLYCLNDTTYEVIGLPPIDRGVDIYRGWNMIGWCSMTPSNASMVCAALPGDQIVARYNGTTYGFDSYIEGLSDIDENFNLSIGEGYYLYSFNTEVLRLDYEGV